MAFIIKKPEPFIIKGEKGEYLIPALTTLSIDQIGDVMLLTPETPVAERIAAVKAFLLRMAPGLEEEDLGDYGYAQIFGAYEKEQGLGK